MSEREPDQLSEIGLALAGAEDAYPLWQAAFLCCGLQPPAERPPSLSPWPTVARMAARIQENVLGHGSVESRLVANARQAANVLRSFAQEQDSPAWGGVLDNVQKVEEKYAELFPDAAGSDGSERTSADSGSIPVEVQRAADRALIPGMVALARKEGCELDLWYYRRDLRIWMDEPENAVFRPAARFLYESEETEHESEETEWSEPAEPMNDREREILHTVIGALIRVLAERKNNAVHRASGKPNISEIARDIDRVLSLDGVPPRGLSNSSVRSIISASLEVPLEELLEAGLKALGKRGAPD